MQQSQKNMLDNYLNQFSGTDSKSFQTNLKA